MFGDIDSVELQAGDRVAALDDAGKMRKARVADAAGPVIGVTFHKGDTVHVRNRSEILPLYRYDASGKYMEQAFVALPAAK